MRRVLIATFVAVLAQALAAPAARADANPIEDRLRSQLKQTTLDPKRRRALKVRIAREVDADQVLNELMGKDASLRYRFIMDNARGVDAGELDV